MNEAPFAYRVFARTGKGTPKPGAPLSLRLDKAVLSGAKAPPTLSEMRSLGRPWSAEDLLLAMDFQAPEVESVIPRSRALCRELAETYGLSHVYDLNMGIGSHVVLESAQVQPGQLVAGCGRCLGVIGGVGAIPVRLGEKDLARALVDGRLELKVPPAIQIRVQGRPPRHAGSLDLAHAVAGAAGSKLSGRIVEFRGETQNLGIDLRIGLSGALKELGAFAALFPPDEVTARFYRERGVQVEADEDSAEAGFEATFSLDLEQVASVTAPIYTGPFNRLGTEGEAVQGVFAGSCYGGRYDDLALVAEILKKRGKVAPGVRLVVSPATLETAQASLAAGFYETFLAAGAMVVVPGGGPGSAGGGAIFGEGERIASTSEYHRDLEPGQGAPEVHVLSPAAAAVAATEGRLVDPAEFLA